MSMSFQMALELKSIRGQILDLVKRIEALEDLREEQAKRRPILKLPATLKKASDG